MLKLITLILLSNTILLSDFVETNLVQNSNNSFITVKEYGKMLYKNPRGIGCHLCHGLKGQGMFIASYKHKIKNEKELKTIKVYAPQISNMDLDTFSKHTNRNKPNSIMPQYFLTKSEIQSLYVYLTSKKNDD
jgi:hypothetical protein